ncbi:MAG: hypothetical protein CMG00_01170 [Candidatus Marinimicrobia bacterium]|nr:hypothetical protein [Candidatus Neomarinimicrobiota bacterium]|tara:strand:- start:10106 stop:11125 length:1020 start_codon:yes stop_codon:yes gene_type:complete
MNIKELAKKLRLSITTVSRALGGYADVSESTRDRVKKYAIKYQYSPNPYARTLASGKTKTVGYVLPIYGTNTSTLNQGNFFQFISGMSDELFSESIQLQILFAKSETEEIKAYKKLILEQKIENIVLQNIKTNDKRIELLNKYKINFVAWGKTKLNQNFSWVDLDNKGAIEIITNYLIKKNHKHISYINISEKYNFANERKSSFLKVLKKNKIKFNNNYYASVKLEEPEKSFEIIKKMLSKNKNITAIICSTEFSALSAIKACNFLKLQIGKHISIITFDGPLVRDLSSPPITAASFPVKKLGKRAINILMDKNKDNKKSYNYLAKSVIIERGSVHTVK